MNAMTIHLILAAPVLIEALIIDPLFWWHGKNDKPWSTYIRGGMVLIASAVAQLSGDNWMLVGMLVSVAYHFAFFQYLINAVLGKPWDYLGDGPFDKAFSHIPNYGRVFFQALAVLAAVLAYYNFNGTIGDSVFLDLPLYTK